MEIKTYATTTANTQLIELLRSKYGNNKNFDYFLNDFNKSFDFCRYNENIIFLPIAGTVNGQLNAHIALIIDKRLPVGEAFFGFLEVQNDTSAFSSLWKNLVSEARLRGISLLKGPINGSIWHQYRCIKESNNSGYFKTELLCEPYYYDLLASKRPDTEIEYYSASREKYEVVLEKISEETYTKLETAGFSIKVVTQLGLKDLARIAEISKSVFKNSWSYTELNEQEFLHLYSNKKLSAYLNTAYLLYKGDEIIGFCSTFKEDSATLVLKTICILPSCQGQGLGNALAYKIHSDARRDGFKKIIYALIREGNGIQKFPQEEVDVFRRYAAFEFHICK